MKVSVVIPAHNEAENIAATIKSVLGQSYEDFEIIVVNNASSDKTQEIAEKFHIKVVLEQKKGLLYARERGRKEAAGEVIANIDADCLPDPDWIASGVKFFNDPKIAAVTGPYDYYDSAPFFKKFSLLSQKYGYSSMNRVLNYFHKGAILIGGNNFIRASVLEKVGGYNTSILFYGEDTDTAKRVSSKGMVIFSKNLLMKTSARRFKSEGTWKISLLYLFHFFRVAFSKNN